MKEQVKEAPKPVNNLSKRGRKALCDFSPLKQDGDSFSFPCTFTKEQRDLLKTTKAEDLNKVTAEFLTARKITVYQLALKHVKNSKIKDVSIYVDTDENNQNFVVRLGGRKRLPYKEIDPKTDQRLKKVNIFSKTETEL